MDTTQDRHDPNTVAALIWNGQILNQFKTEPFGIHILNGSVFEWSVENTDYRPNIQKRNHYLHYNVFNDISV